MSKKTSLKWSALVFSLHVTCYLQLRQVLMRTFTTAIISCDSRTRGPNQVKSSSRCIYWANMSYKRTKHDDPSGNHEIIRLAVKHRTGKSTSYLTSPLHLSGLFFDFSSTVSLQNEIMTGVWFNATCTIWVFNRIWFLHQGVFPLCRHISPCFQCSRCPHHRASKALLA